MIHSGRIFQRLRLQSDQVGTTVGNGAGQTIAIVDAYDDPSIANNLSVFDKQFGLPDPKLTKVNETGGSTMPIASQSWCMEISLDVEWAHAMAPGGNILLVEANSSGLTDLMTAVNYARSQPGVSVVSMSWGASEFSGQQSFDSYFTTPAGHTGETFIASSGDGGAGANWPAVSPNVVAVGGTTLSVTSSGTYTSETAWSGSGGGASAIYSTPSYQVGVQTTGHRTVPDVSFDANPSTGFAVYDTAGGSRRLDAGRRHDAGAPQWAALVAIADQGRALSNQRRSSGTDTNLYKLSASDFHDITSGSNGAYSAKAGYDEVTGRGSPYANLVVRDLVNATFTTPSAPVYGPPVIFIPPLPSSAGGHSIEGAGGSDFNSIATSISTEPSTIVGATSLTTNTAAVSSPIYFAFAGLKSRLEAGSAGIVEEVPEQIDAMPTTESETVQNAAADPASAPVETPAVSEIDAALMIEELDLIELPAPAVNFEAAASPALACRPSTRASLRTLSCVRLPRQHVGRVASEHPATTSLAVLAGFVIGGWRPAASALEQSVWPNVVRLCGRMKIPIVNPRRQKTSRFARQRPAPNPSPSQRDRICRANSLAAPANGDCRGGFSLRPSK